MSPARAATELRLLSNDYALGQSITLAQILAWLDSLDEVLSEPAARLCVCGFCDGEECL